MTEFTLEQVELEREMSSLGEEAYRVKAADARKSGKETHTIPGRRMLREAVGRMAIGMDEWFKHCRKSAGRHNASLKYLDQLSSDVISLITAKVILDRISHSRTRTVLCGAIGRALQDEAKFKFIRKQDPEMFDRVMRKTKRAGYDKRSRTFKANLRDAPFEFDEWPKREVVRAGSVCLVVFVERAGLVTEESKVEHSPIRRPKTRLTIEPTDDTMRWLDRAHQEQGDISPFWMPMVDVPDDWSGMYGGGYKTQILLRKPMAKVYRKSHLRRLEEADLSRVNTGVNYIQSVPWRVNQGVFEVAKHFWEHSIELAGLPPSSKQPLPPHPHDIKYNEVSRLDWRRAAARVYDKNVKDRSHRIQAARTLFVAGKYEGREFYFPQSLDFRGRVYPVPYFLQPQGPSFARGLLEFTKPVAMTQPGLKALHLHGAAKWGAKGSRAERFEWVSANSGMIISVGTDPLEFQEWTEADDPWGFLAYCLEADDAAQGKPTHLPCFIDGSNNGLQIFSLLMRNEHIAVATNVAPNEYPEDLYQRVADHVTDMLVKIAGNSSANHEHAAWASAWLVMVSNRMPRKAVKRVVMTLPYDVTKFACKKYIREWSDETVAAGTPWPFPDLRFKYTNFLAEVVWQCMEKELGPAMECMVWLKQCARIMGDAGLPMIWETPSGFLVTQEYTNYMTKVIKTTAGQRTRKSTIRVGTDGIHITKQTRGISPNFVHSMDAACLMLVALKCRADKMSGFAVIHDGFGAHAPNVAGMAKNIRDAYIDVFSEDQLLKFKRDLEKRSGITLPDPPGYGSFSVGSLADSIYMFD